MTRSGSHATIASVHGLGAAHDCASETHHQEVACSTVLNPGNIVVLSLVNPREKFWGALLGVSPSGISIRGLDLGSFDGAVTMIRNGEQHAPVEVFFPMHRVERMEADTDTSGIPSIQQRFEKATGHEAVQFLNSGR